MKLAASGTIVLLGALACADSPTGTPADDGHRVPVLASGGGGGGGGGDQGTGPIQNVFFNANPVVSGDTTSLLVSFTEPAPAAGYTLTLRSSDPAMQIPSSWFVPPGERSTHAPVTTTPILDARFVTATVTLEAQSKSNSVKLFPRTATLVAPTLFKPGDRSSFKMREIVDFDWNDQNNAWCYHLQMDDDGIFEPFPAFGDLCTPNSFWRQSAFGPVGSTTYWRVQAQDASGNPGPWSPVRTFVIK